MIERYTLEEKPSLKYGQYVVVDMAVMGGKGYLPGKIVGKGSENILDFWLVEFDKDFSPSYPYRVTTILHTAVVKSMPIKDFINALSQNDGVERDMATIQSNLKQYLKES
jgi:hypothetical protein